MQFEDPNCPLISVGEAMPMARQILKGGVRLAAELASRNSPCSNQEYLTHLSNATAVLTALVAHNLKMDGQNA
jgi:hypothetical protein